MLKEITLDLSEIDMQPPEECKTDYCYEETEAVVIIRKTWKPLLSVISRDSMTTW